MLNDRRLLIKYSLGYVAEPLPGDNRFQGMLSIPYLTPSGNVAAMKFRNLTGHGDKNAQHSGQKVRFYNTRAWFEAEGEIGIAEGETDAIAASEFLGLPTVGIPGATNWDDLWYPLFKDFTRVILLGDGDQAGREMNERLEDKIGWRALNVTFPDGEDVCSMVLAGRSGELTSQWTSTSNEAA